MTLLEAREMRGTEGCSPELARRRRGGEGGRAASARRAARAAESARQGDSDVRAPHTPMLAAELIELLDPQPGQTAIDCTFGDGGHARLLAGALGASGTLVAIDRDPLAQERFDRLAAEVACSVRFIDR